MSGTDSIFLFLAWGLSVFAGLVALWVCVGRRSRAPHCPKCHYSLTDWTPERPKCPECGRVSPGGRDLQRRCRRWSRLFIAAFILCVAYAVTVIPRTQERGWVGTIPTPLLVCVRPWVSPSDTTPFDRQVDGVMTQLSDEVSLRDSNGEIAWLWQRVRLLRTRIAFAWEGQTGPSSRDLEIMDRLGNSAVADPGSTMSAVVAASEKAVAMKFVVDWDDFATWQAQPGTTSVPIPGLSVSTTLDTFFWHGAGGPAFAVSSWTVRDGAVLIYAGRPSDDTPVFNSYSVADAARACLGDTPEIEGGQAWATAQMVVAVESLVTPELWWNNGGAFSGPRILGGRLILVGPPRSHHQTQHLLTAIAIARPDAPAALGTGELDVALARRVMEMRIEGAKTATDLASLARLISDLLGSPCEVDAASLQRVGLAPTSAIPTPNGRGLSDVLSRVGNTAISTDTPTWTVRDGVVIILADAVRENYAFIRLYDIGRFTSLSHVRGASRHPGDSYIILFPVDEQILVENDSLTDRLSSEIEPDHWTDNGGSQIWAISLGMKLAVLAPAPAHVRIEGFLQAHGAETAKPSNSTTPPPMPE